MTFKKIIYYFFKALRNPTKAIFKVKNYATKAYIFIKRNDRPTLINESKPSSVLDLKTFSKVPLIAIFSRKKFSYNFYDAANQYIAENNKFIVNKGVAIVVKNINETTTKLRFSSLDPWIGKKFIVIDVYTLAKIENMASTSYHIFVCIITNEEEKKELLNEPKLLRYINIIISVGVYIGEEDLNAPLVIRKSTLDEALSSIEFIISSQINYEDALIPLKIPAHYDVKIAKQAMKGLDAYFKLRKIDRSPSISFDKYLERNLNEENISQIYVNEVIELLYATLITTSKVSGDWAPLATRLLEEGYYLEISN